MRPAQPAGADADAAILDEAVDWLVRLQSGDATDGDRAALARWRARSPQHEAVWRRAEEMLSAFRQVPSGLGRGTLARAGKAGRRRQALRLGLLALAAPAAWLAWRDAPWREWTADLRTATGQRRSVALADGTRLVLNTASAVDVRFSATERRLTLLAGEILVTTGRDPAPAPRPLVVLTAQGSLQPLGTRFAVRRLDDSTRVAVFDGAVQVRPAAGGAAATVRAGEQMSFTAAALQPLRPAEPGAALWERGMLLARDMRLDELAAELGRYRRGILRCDPAVAGLVISGAFPVDDVQASLALLEQTLPLRVSYLTPYWITLAPR